MSVLGASRAPNVVIVATFGAQAAPRAVALEPMANVELLLEMAGERDRHERPAGCDELHRGGQAALDDGGRKLGINSREELAAAFAAG